MLTGRAAELRPDVNYLHVHPRRLDVPQTPKTAAPGDFAETLHCMCLNENLRRKRDKAQRDGVARGRAIERGVTFIPASGAARRRAKAKRNRDAVAAIAATRDLTVIDTIRDMRLRNAPWTLNRCRAEIKAIPQPDLLAEVLDWCSAHPYEGELPESGALTMRRERDTVVVEGEPPAILAISGDLLDMADRAYLSFTDGVLIMNVQPEPLHYAPLGPHPSSRVVVFERILWED